MKTIRRARAEDIHAIHIMTQAVYAEYRELLPHSSVWQETPEVVAAEMELGPIFLGLVEGAIAASVRCHVKHSDDWGDFVYVHRLAVLADHRRQGWGCVLMQAVEDWARSLPLRYVRLEIRAMQPENLQFYQKLNYEIGSISGYLPDGSPRSYWMSKDLGERHYS